MERDPSQKKRLYQEQLALMEMLGNANMIATAYLHIGTALWLDGDYAEALTAFEASRSHYEQVKNRSTFPWLWLYIGLAAQSGGDLQYAGACYEKSMADFRDVKNEFRFPFYLFDKRVLAIVKGLFELATELNEEARLIALKNDNQDCPADVLYFKCRLTRIQGDMVSAQQYAEAANNQKDLEGYLKMMILLELGYLALERSNFTQARSLFREGVRILINNYQYLDWISYPITAMATLAAREVKVELAARLFGTRWRRGIFYFYSPVERAQQENDLAVLKETLGEAFFDEIYQEGRAMTLGKVLALMLENEA
jgi:tetratricopeptide (TPR) repeat protein